MRLSQHSILVIAEAINQHVSLQQAELRLFGSRTKDNSRGGDIDLLLVLPDKMLYQEVAQKKIAILVEIQKQLGDQKIDLTLATKEELKVDPFLKLIFPSSVILHSWLPS